MAFNSSFTNWINGLLKNLASRNGVPVPKWKLSYSVIIPGYKEPDIEIPMYFLRLWGTVSNKPVVRKMFMYWVAHEFWHYHTNIRKVIMPKEDEEHEAVMVGIHVAGIRDEIELAKLRSIVEAILVKGT